MQDVWQEKPRHIITLVISYCHKILMKIQLVVFTWSCDQKNTQICCHQTDKLPCYNTTFLAEVIVSKSCTEPQFHSVPSLRLVSPGAVTDGVNLYSPKKLTTFFSHRYHSQGWSAVQYSCKFIRKIFTLWLWVTPRWCHLPPSPASPSDATGLTWPLVTVLLLIGLCWCFWLCLLFKPLVTFVCQHCLKISHNNSFN